MTVNGFSSAGVQRDPFVVPARAGAYAPGAGYPANATGNNYWIQPVFEVPPPKPTTSTTLPLDGTTNVRVDSRMTVTFADPVEPGSAVLAVTDPGGAQVAGLVSYDPAARTATFAPAAPLAPGTAYRLRVSGARATRGPAMDPVTAGFATAGATACPCTVFSSTAVPGTADAGDAAAVVLGLKFVPTTAGQVTGLRFYKAAANEGPHTGSLWTSDGQRLAAGSFDNETTSGWQYLTFAQPVAVTAGQTYLVSYFAPRGHYSADLEGLAAGWTNGPLQVTGAASSVYVYGSDAFPTFSYRNTNYWVDPLFDTVQ